MKCFIHHYFVTGDIYNYLFLKISSKVLYYKIKYMQLPIFIKYLKILQLIVAFIFRHYLEKIIRLSFAPSRVFRGVFTFIAVDILNHDS